jgi:hypothetical protein
VGIVAQVDAPVLDAVMLDRTLSWTVPPNNSTPVPALASWTFEAVIESSVLWWEPLARMIPCQGNLPPRPS